MSHRQNLKYAFLGYPITGGVYTVYRNLRDGLAKHDITVRWVGLGQKAQAILSQEQWQHEWPHGEVVACDSINASEQCARLVEHLQLKQYDGVIVNILTDPIQTNAVRYLPVPLSKLMIVHTTSPAAYAAASVLRDRVNFTVCVSPRIQRDLIKKHSFVRDVTYCVPNGIDLDKYQQRARNDESSRSTIKLIYLGRIDDTAKGVLWIPKILSHLRHVDYMLTIAGDGPDLGRLQKLCAPYHDRIVFAGHVDADTSVSLLCDADILVFPSRFEGLGLSLVESMATGCVPVASRIAGVTDYVVENNKSGFLFPVGDCKAAAENILLLCRDRRLLKRMSDNARSASFDRFSLQEMVASYAEIIKCKIPSSVSPLPPLPINRWEMPSKLGPGFRRFVPESVKNLIRVWKERLQS